MLRSQGARSLQAITGADEPTVKAIRAARIGQCAVFQWVGIGAFLTAILLIELA